MDSLKFRSRIVRTVATVSCLTLVVGCTKHNVDTLGHHHGGPKPVPWPKPKPSDDSGQSVNGQVAKSGVNGMKVVK
jgi:hypothetical protein